MPSFKNKNLLFLLQSTERLIEEEDEARRNPPTQRWHNRPEDFMTRKPAYPLPRDSLTETVWTHPANQPTRAPMRNDQETTPMIFDDLNAPIDFKVRIPNAHKCNFIKPVETDINVDISKNCESCRTRKHRWNPAFISQNYNLLGSIGFIRSISNLHNANSVRYLVLFPADLSNSIHVWPLHPSLVSIHFSRCDGFRLSGYRILD